MVGQAWVAAPCHPADLPSPGQAGLGCFLRSRRASLHSLPTVCLALLGTCLSSCAGEGGAMEPLTSSWASLNAGSPTLPSLSLLFIHPWENTELITLLLGLS